MQPAKRDLHNKTYHPMLELRKRRVWEDNLHRINKHNAEATIGHHSYTLRANHLADMVRNNAYISYILRANHLADMVRNNAYISYILRTNHLADMVRNNAYISYTPGANHLADMVRNNAYISYILRANHLADMVRNNAYISYILRANHLADMVRNNAYISYILRANHLADMVRNNAYISYILRANHLADMTARQYVRQMVKLTKSRRRRIGDNLVGGVNYQQLDIPEELDWRKKGFVTRSLNQLDCGSCYAFSIVTAIEGQLFKQTGQYTELRSAQVLNLN
uniref:Cathepsin propeptide inhibitor domain-containing protein n=1 Tax=Timema douglasi TaxID=61478 RepID=A0A7R8VZD4_TIMDO|nr:unnamed protein product [Timema douglasi]